MEKELYAEEAKERQLAQLKQFSTVKEPVPERQGQSRDLLGKTYGVSGKTIDQVDKIKQVAPERLEDIRKGDTSIKAVYTELMRQQHRKSREQEYKDSPLPEGVFDVILADPPWEYEFCPTLTREIENHYLTMELKDIKAIEIPAADDAVLFLWATAEAERRMLAGTPIKSDPSVPGRQGSSKTSANLSAVYGVGARTIERVDKIKQVAPERLEDIRKGDASIKAASMFAAKVFDQT